MRIIRGRPATGKAPKIVCTGCGKRAAEAGVAVPDLADEKGYSRDGPIRMIDEDEAQPLCEDCVTALERADQR
jgi:hypothetical protein